MSLEEIKWPSNWSQTTLERVCEKPQYGFTASAQSRDTGVHFLRITDLREGNLDWDEVPFCECSKNDFPRYALETGDLVVARIGATTGRTSLVLNPPKAVFASYLIRLRHKKEVNPFFLYFYTQSSSYWVRINSSKDSNLKGGVNASVLTQTKVPLPPLPEQRKIASVLWKVQQAVETEAAIVRNARDLKKSLLRHLFIHGLRNEPLKETEIGPLPESWDVRALASVSKLERGRFMHRPRNEPRFYGGSTPFVQTGDVVRSEGRIRTHTQTLNDEGVKISRVFPTGAILITIAANIGYTGILEFDSACPDSLVGITPSELVDADFLLYYLQTQQPVMDERAPRGTQKNINIQFLTPWPVALPPKDEQREIAGILQTVDDKIAVHEAKQRELQDLFKTSLHQLMTAHLRVNHLDIDTSEVEVRV